MQTPYKNLRHSQPALFNLMEAPSMNTWKSLERAGETLQPRRRFNINYIMRCHHCKSPQLFLPSCKSVILVQGRTDFHVSWKVTFHIASSKIIDELIPMIFSGPKIFWMHKPLELKFLLPFFMKKSSLFFLLWTLLIPVLWMSPKMFISYSFKIQTDIDSAKIFFSISSIEVFLILI